jgi:poly(A) polymerase
VVDEIATATWRQGEQFGTIGCRVGSYIFEITTHRADAYEPDSRKPMVAFGDSIDDDLMRRDFTVNAMAIDMADRALIDPFGGRADLAAGVLRTPLDPRISFSEDPLRMIRAARFIAGYGLSPVPALVTAVTAMADRVEIVSVERVRDEIEKLLLVADPSPGFEFLVETGLWSRVLRDLDPASIERRGRRVSASGPSVVERWAAFVSLDRAEALAPLRLSNAVVADVSWLLEVMARLTDALPKDDRDLRMVGELVPEGETLERAIDFAEALLMADAPHGADRPGPTPMEEVRARVADLRAREPDFDHPVLPLDGDQVMALLDLEPGPSVGRAIERLRRHRVDHGPLTAERATEILMES